MVVRPQKKKISITKQSKTSKHSSAGKAAAKESSEKELRLRLLLSKRMRERKNAKKVQVTREVTVCDGLVGERVGD